MQAELASKSDLASYMEGLAQDDRATLDRALRQEELIGRNDTAVLNSNINAINVVQNRIQREQESIEAEYALRIQLVGDDTEKAIKLEKEKQREIALKITPDLEMIDRLEDIVEEAQKSINTQRERLTTVSETEDTIRYGS